MYNILYACMPRCILLSSFHPHLDHAREQFIVDLFKRELRAVIVDVAPMSFLRPDGHAFAEEDVLQGDPLKVSEELAVCYATNTPPP